MNKWQIGLIMIIGLSFCGGCQTYNHLQPIHLYGAPTVEVYQDPEVDWGKYKTFSVFPFSLLDKKNKLDTIEQKQVLFFIRNCLELLGYELVKPDEKPDFLITVDFDCKYQTYDIPPQIYTVPKYIPGETITTYQNTYGNVKTYGDINIWGTYSGRSTATTYIPGYIITETRISDGYTVGCYCPSASVLIYDGATNQNIWKAIGMGISDNGNFRVSGQVVLMQMLAKLPSRVKDPKLLKGYIGILWWVVTLDGNNYFPSVLLVSPNSPAERAQLRQEDIISYINEEPTVNKSWSQIWEMLDRPEGTELNLKIWRGDKLIDKKIIKPKHPEEKKQAVELSKMFSNLTRR